MELELKARGQPIATHRVRRTSVRAIVARAVLLALIVIGVPSDGHLGTARLARIAHQAVSGKRFDLVSWEIQAIGQKVRDGVQKPGSDLSPDAQRELVVAYMDGINRLNALTREIEAAAAGVERTGAARGVAELQAELDDLRVLQADRRPAVEWIIERQVSTVLEELGFSTAGMVVPPVSFQFTESPNYLIVSPRDRIRVERGIHLDPTLSIEEMEEIEAEVSVRSDRSTIIEGTGGFSSYPTMVLEYGVLRWGIDTVAHEWAHLYLFPRPLGWNYDASGDMRTINETVASMFGEEVSRLVMERYYPDLLSPAPWPRPLSKQEDWLSPARVETSFEFGAFMRETRLEVDRLLAAGQIEAAEAYMQARRGLLVERGYSIRKLNQAYFAFHGSYAVGTSATDPIGGKLRALRLRTDTLATFMQIVARFDAPADLDAVLG